MPGILADSAIAAAIAGGSIKITPYDPALLNPGSVDLTLGPEVAVYEDWVHCYERSQASQFGGHRETFEDGQPYDPAFLNPGSVDLTLGPEVAVYEDGQHFVSKPDGVIDVKKEPRIRKFKIDPDKGWILKPGIGYLMHTQERIWTDQYVPVIDGKSSIGRLFIQVHATAGYGEVGFDGQYTLEVIVQKAVRVYAGMRFCQIRFHTTEGEVEKPYNVVGNYRGEAAQGAVGSLAWRQFQPPAG